MNQFLFILAMTATAIAPANVDAKTAPARKPAQVDNHLAAPGDAKQATEAEIEKTLQQKAENEFLVGVWKVNDFGCTGNFEGEPIKRMFEQESTKETAELINEFKSVLREKIYRNAEGKLFSERDSLSHSLTQDYQANRATMRAVGHGRCRIQHVSEIAFDRENLLMRYLAPIQVRCHPECTAADCKELRTRKVLADHPWRKPEETLPKLLPPPELFVDPRNSAPIEVRGTKASGMSRIPKSNNDPDNPLYFCKDVKTGKLAGSGRFSISLINE